jgi:hypothetical protein
MKSNEVNLGGGGGRAGRFEVHFGCSIHNPSCQLRHILVFLKLQTTRTSLKAVQRLAIQNETPWSDCYLGDLGDVVAERATLEGSKYFRITAVTLYPQLSLFSSTADNCQICTSGLEHTDLPTSSRLLIYGGEVFGDSSYKLESFLNH